MHQRRFDYWSFYQPGWTKDHLIGPVNEAEFVKFIEAGSIKFRTPVFSQTRTNGWRYAENLPPLRTAIGIIGAHRLKKRRRLKARLQKYFNVISIWFFLFVYLPPCPYWLTIGGWVVFLWALTDLTIHESLKIFNAPMTPPITFLNWDCHSSASPILTTVHQSYASPSATCGMCREQVETQAQPIRGQVSLVECKKCQTIYHDDCWEYLGKCSIFGCGCTKFKHHAPASRHR